MGRLGLVEGKVWARYLAPVVFLLAVTGVVLAVRAGLRSHDEPARTKPSVATKTVPAPRSSSAGAKRYYLVRSGDTLGAIASQLGTSVAALLRMNPGVEPTALRPGQRLRVR